MPERHKPLELIPYARRVSEMLGDSKTFEHWRKRCHESFLEYRERAKRYPIWDEERIKYLCDKGKRIPLSKKPPEGWVPSSAVYVLLSRKPATASRKPRNVDRKFLIVRGWVPPEYADDQAPYNGGPIPFSAEHRLSIADCYFVLALIYDAIRRDGPRISLFDSNKNKSPADMLESIFWCTRSKHLASMGEADSMTLDACLRLVEADIALAIPAKTGDIPATKTELAASINEKANAPNLAAGASEPSTQVKRKRSTQKGDAETMLIAALLKHHKYADRGALNHDPVVSNELARAAKVAPSSASRFFDKHFLAKDEEGSGHASYAVACRRNFNGIVLPKLIFLSGEYPIDESYGAVPPGERGRDDD